MNRPTHRVITTGAAVFPEGYDQAKLELLPAGYWEAEDEAMAIEAIKSKAESDIIAIAPIWQQLNDIRQPSPEGDARFAAIDAVRTKSDADEAKVKKAKQA